jgi:hypothetical protein
MVVGKDGCSQIRESQRPKNMKRLNSEAFSTYAVSSDWSEGFKYFLGLKHLSTKEDSKVRFRSFHARF